MDTGAPAARLADACKALGDAPLSPAGVATHLRPLFARVLAASGERIYLANHSLGRPLDVMALDVQEGLTAWYETLGAAWEPWLAEIAAYRARLATLLGTPRADAVVPKTSAAQGLRAVLNSFDAPPRVVATRGEFDSIDVVLREYARRGRIALDLVAPDRDGMFQPEAITAVLRRGADLAVLSPVLFQTGQRLPGLADLVADARARGTRVMLDVYHALGVLPMDLAALGADYAIGGSYKYLRGGPGACFLYVAPAILDAGLRTLDTGWFAKAQPFAYERPDPPRFAPGGDGWLESTPPVLPFYQARAGQCFTLGVGVARLRAYSLGQQQRLVALLAAHGVTARGGDADHGAFVTVRHAGAGSLARAMGEHGIAVDARGGWLRLCPDVLTTDAELGRAAEVLGRLVRSSAPPPG